MAGAGERGAEEGGGGRAKEEAVHLAVGWGSRSSEEERSGKKLVSFFSFRLCFFF